MTHPAWLLIVLGVILALIGIVWLVLPAVPGLGRLPGDIRIEGEHGGFYFPITTCLVLSALLSLVFWIVHQLGR
jgi:hypothetical protein